ncbi:RNA-binding protein cabeza-like [Eucalyptus grandis]|uniref:RNA-binding protein cabeza-like n=1 Tax=Eucalyptus grandis TaxID=71139 RepID=UPI00192EA197|nr:RNA-binding protein cabeza-like [Eucalyptus grandis]
MATFRFTPLALFFVVLLLLSGSPRSSAHEVTVFMDETIRQQQQRQLSDNVWSPFRVRKIGTHVVKRLGGGGGGGGGGSGGGHLGGGGGGGGRTGEPGCWWWRQWRWRRPWRHSHLAAASSAAHSHRDS